MRNIVAAVLASTVLAGTAFSQNSFVVTGTPIPVALLQQNYGNVPKGVTAYDLSICNVSATKQSIVSSEIYQAVSNANGSLQPIGREIMLTAIIRNQNRNFFSIAGIALNSATTALSILGSSKLHASSGLLTGIALASTSGEQILNSVKPIFSADQLHNFETQVLEQALVLDGGSCVERTMFTLTAAPKSKPQALSFRVR